MRRHPFSLGGSLMGMVAAGAALVAMGAGTRAIGGAADNIGDLVPDRHKRHRGKGQNNRRGRGVVAKQARRPNMRTVSKRTRAKHRKAAKRG